MNNNRRGDKWSLRAFASIREHCDFFASTSRNKKICFASLRATQKFGEHEQASTRLNFASKSSKGKILRAVLKNFDGPFITPNRPIRHYRFSHDSWFSHDVTKIKTNKLFLPRFYFHDALKQLKANFHTDFHFKRFLVL